MKKGLALMLAFVIFMLSYKQGNLLLRSHEINELEFVRTVALDKGSDGNMRLSILMKKEKQGSASSGGVDSGGGGESGESVIFTGEGSTALSTQNFFQTYSDKYLFFGHADYVIIGEDAAREDIRKYLDFITRDHEYRLNLRVYIAVGKAEDILASSKTFLPDKLRSLYKSADVLSISNELPLFELVSRIEDNRLYAVAVPVIKLIEIESLEKMQDKKQQSGQGGQQEGSSTSGQGPGAAAQKTKEVALGGFAIIKDFQLTGFLDDVQSRSYLFVTNRFSSGTVDVKNQTGNYVGIEIIEQNTQIMPVISDGVLKGITVKTTFHSNVDEIHGTENIFKENNIKFIEKEQSEQIKNEIESLFRFAQDRKADFMGVGQAISVSHPVIWQEYKDKWPEIFAGLQVNVQVESIIHRSYDINEPIGNNGQ